MENAEIKIEKTKKGKVVGYFVFKVSGGEDEGEEKQKTMPFPSWLADMVPSVFSLEKSGHSCEVLREKGQPVKVIFEKKEYNKPKEEKQARPRQTAGQGGNRQQAGHNRYQNRNAPRGQVQSAGNAPSAVAPYNFVPLNTNIVLSKNQNFALLDSYIDDSEKADSSEKLYSGRIKFNLETKTPFFIRGSAKHGSSGNEISDYDFFSPGGKIKIPGSSIRGMIRTLVEIVSHGKFENTDGERQLYYRFIAEKPPLGDEYRGRMTDQGDNHYPKIEAGLLKKSLKTPGGYVIISAKSSPHGQIYRVKYNSANGSLTCNSQITLQTSSGSNYAFKAVYFKPVEPVPHDHSRGRQLKYALVEEVSPQEPASGNQGFNKGYLVYSGGMPNKKMQWIINEVDTNVAVKDIPSQVIDDYNNDENRGAVNLLELPETNKGGVPCFYLTNSDGKVVSFGHTGMFRLAYDKRIAEHLPGEIRNQGERNDIAESIFGVESKFASRLYVEDALIESGQDDPYLTTEHKHPKILSTPKPTTVQHYLMQGNNEETHSVVNRNQLNSWNSDKHIRGYKLYWHRDINELGDNHLHSWIAPPDQVMRYQSQYECRIKPLKKGIKFTGSLRFENMADYELGALLFVLALPDNCCHKLGLAKPLGFGSVKIVPELVITSRIERYRKLFSEEKNWYLAEEIADLEIFKQAFAKYVLEQLGQPPVEGDTAVSSLWKQSRLKELKQMLCWNPANDAWLENTQYMSIAGPGLRFRDRPVLPLPSQVRRS